MWKEIISRINNDWGFENPAPAVKISEAENNLRVKFPDELKSLLAETGGVLDSVKHGTSLILGIDRILKDNMQLRQEALKGTYMPLDHLLLFAEAGNGDYFGYAVKGDGEIKKTDIFSWNHEDDSRKWVASSLEQFLEWWKRGTIKT